MAYIFSAEKSGPEDLVVLRERLRVFSLVEFFPVEASGEETMLAVSIPFKSMEDSRFGTQLMGVMNCLIVEHGFTVIDLYSGTVVRVEDIPELSKVISS